MAHQKEIALLLCVAITSLGWGNMFGAQRKTAFHIEEATIGDIQSEILARHITTVDVVNMYLFRIKAYMSLR